MNNSSKQQQGNLSLQEKVRRHLAKAPAHIDYDSLTEKEQSEACFAAACQIYDTLGGVVNTLNSNNVKRPRAKKGGKWTHQGVVQHQEELEKHGVPSKYLRRPTECDWSLIKRFADIDFAVISEPDFS